MMSRSEILVVDEDPSVRSAITFALEAEGFAVRTFANAGAALAGAASGRPACIAIDHRPPGLDALALLAQLRANGLGVPAIVITSNPSSRLRQRIADAGARLIEKPLLGDPLAVAIRTLVAGEGERA